MRHFTMHPPTFLLPPTQLHPNWNQPPCDSKCALSLPVFFTSTFLLALTSCHIKVCLLPKEFCLTCSNSSFKITPKGFLFVRAAWCSLPATPKGKGYSTGWMVFISWNVPIPSSLWPYSLRYPADSLEPKLLCSYYSGISKCVQGWPPPSQNQRPEHCF